MLLKNKLSTQLEISQKINWQLKKELVTAKSYPTMVIGYDCTSTSADYAGSSEDNDFGTSDIYRNAGTSSGGWADCKVLCSEQYGNGKAWAFLDQVQNHV
ncbi:MAG: hypothetical protein H5T98_06505 [Syntrophomonadaceae bacterium]|nr:hypothetical protein [Syntrophomonadaceae bacterium]